jgi:hypothetical protein
MLRFILSLAVGLAGLSLQASAPTQKAPVPAVSPHKSSKVPVSVTTLFGDGKATVTLRFNQATTDAVIGFRGLDGLAVNSVPPIAQQQFKRGETLVLEVLVTPGLGQSHLAVDIEGRFAGQHRMGVQTFAVGKPTLEQQKATTGNLVTTTSGQRIKIMPVRPQ